MTTLKLTVPDTVDVDELQREIVTAVSDRLRDEHGYELVASMSPIASEAGHEYPLHPSGSIVVDEEAGGLKVRLHGVGVDAHDLFTGVSSEVEQRHEGLRAELA